MQLRDKAQNSRFWKLINEMGIDEDTRRMLVSQATGGRTESSSKMYKIEMSILLDHLKELNADETSTDTADRLRKKIISMAHEMNWELVGGRADMDRINNWCIKYGKYHRPLNDHSVVELGILISQFERGPYLDHLNAVS